MNNTENSNSQSADLARLRRLAAKAGLRVTSHYNHTFGCQGFMLIDIKTNALFAGGSPVPFSITSLEELEGAIEYYSSVNQCDDADIAADDFEQF